ncbi:DNA-processing protein DprA [Mesorhizobium ventifaucium]|uniref:DNA protection protein n=1 Tax=Mesorhizobium ventifaucium TaxID=666020 RepID=A0ABM9DM90_9HYPH|nr:DNA-processing protein DprA [Mesorhizobium ventifaucium]CAH2397751.1 DNA protection protein [Mesorhizobium ventifaucium]
MMPSLSPNAKAILLITAHLIVGRNSPKSDILTLSEYNRLAQRLREVGCEPADLLAARSAESLQVYRTVVDIERLQRLLGRGFQLSQAVERWQARAIWVISRPDPAYPQRLKARLGSQAPALLFGCGEVGLLDKGGLAVVGSRHIDDDLFDYTMAVGRLVARADRSIISGGAKGIDQAAMRGALEEGGQACGVLADSLEKQAMVREHRNMLLHGQLALVSPYDPNAAFHVGNAMQRNKLIYALADASLVVSSDLDKGGTWAGATEQLDKFKFGPLYVRSTGDVSPGLAALRRKGAWPWPNPDTPEALQETLNASAEEPSQGDLALFAAKMAADISPAPHVSRESAPTSSAIVSHDGAIDAIASEQLANQPEAPAEILFATVRELILRHVSDHSMKDDDVADVLRISSRQAKQWLGRLVDEGHLEKVKKPAGYKLKQRRLIE